MSKSEAALEAQTQQQQEEEEVRQEGHVQPGVYFAYSRAAGWQLVAVLAVSFILMQVNTKNSADVPCMGTHGTCAQSFYRSSLRRHAALALRLHLALRR